MGDRFKGTSVEQDVRFKDKEKKLLKTMKFPSILDKKVPFDAARSRKLDNSTGEA